MTVFGDFARDAEFEAFKVAARKAAHCQAQLDQLTARNPRCAPWVPGQADIDSERPLLEAVAAFARHTDRPQFDFGDALATLSPARLV